MLQFVGYACISTAEQSAAFQLDALKAAGCEWVFSETAFGAQRNRRELHQALGYMRKGDVLVVWRLARSVRQLVDTTADLHARGIELRSLHDAIDSSTGTGRLTFHLFAALAEFERNVIRSRTAIGLEAPRARGRKGGRPRRRTRTLPVPCWQRAARPLLRSRGGFMWLSQRSTATSMAADMVNYRLTTNQRESQSRKALVRTGK